MKIITDCPLCKTDFMYDPNHDFHLKVDLNNIEEIYSDYPIKDETWASRRWNKDRTDYVDLSGGITICQDCHEKRSNAEDVNVDGHIVCAKKGCAHDANEFSKYCHGCYDEMYPPLHKESANGA